MVEVSPFTGFKMISPRLGVTIRRAYFVNFIAQFLCSTAILPVFVFIVKNIVFEAFS